MALDLAFATALKRAFAQGYDLRRLRTDLMAGAVVGVVALPLSMALAIGAGVPPQHGLYTAVIAGFIVALTGGSKHQVTGPTAAFIVILAPISANYGLSGLLTAGLMAGLMLVVLGISKLGKLIQFIPHPVTTGFTAGIAGVIATLQIKDVFGLRVEHLPDGFTEKLATLWNARATASPWELSIAIGMLALLLLLPRLLPRLTRLVPAPLLALVLTSLYAAVLIPMIDPGLEIATIGSRFQTLVDGELVRGIPRRPPVLALPWGDHGLGWTELRALAPAAFAIAALGAIESLLSAVVADGMTGTKHDPDAELLALRLGNIIAPFFGGIAATGALARTATNIRSGATSPIAAAFHAVVVLLAIVLLAPLLSHIPMSALAGLLLLVAWNMSELPHFLHTARSAPRSDVVVLFTCFSLTVVFDMIVAVSVGVVLASLLFMRRMAELTNTRISSTTERGLPPHAIPAGVAVYEIAGPLFFGAAQKAIGALTNVGARSKVLVLDLEDVPVIDATGLVALESALARLRGRLVILAALSSQVAEVVERASLTKRYDNLEISDTVADALELARHRIATRAVETIPPGPKAHL